MKISKVAVATVLAVIAMAILGKIFSIPNLSQLVMPLVIGVIQFINMASALQIKEKQSPKDAIQKISNSLLDIFKVKGVANLIAEFAAGNTFELNSKYLGWNLSVYQSSFSFSRENTLSFLIPACDAPGYGGGLSIFGNGSKSFWFRLDFTNNELLLGFLNFENRQHLRTGDVTFWLQFLELGFTGDFGNQSQVVQNWVAHTHQKPIGEPMLIDITTNLHPHKVDIKIVMTQAKGEKATLCLTKEVEEVNEFDIEFVQPKANSFWVPETMIESALDF